MGTHLWLCVPFKAGSLNCTVCETTPNMCQLGALCVDEPCIDAVLRVSFLLFPVLSLGDREGMPVGHAASK